MLCRTSIISGFVLAGGDSRRMGKSKPHLILRGETMLERQVRLLRRVCRSVAVVGPGGDSADIGAPFLSDQIPDRGPLGGIYTGLAQSRTEFNLFVACDLPFLEPRLLMSLNSLALQSQADITFPEDRQGRIQPLCAIYRRKILRVVRARLAQGANKTDGYFRSVRLCVMPWREIVRAGFVAHIFDNINRPEDWEEARMRVGDI